MTFYVISEGQLSRLLRVLFRVGNSIRFVRPPVYLHICVKITMDFK